MRRFFHGKEPDAGGVIVLAGAEAHHAAHVIRLRRGEPAVVLDGRGHEYLCEALSIDRHEVRLQVRESTFHERRPETLRLVQAITRGRSFDSIIQHAVELGCDEIEAMITERVIARPSTDEAAGKRGKWEQAAIEAIKQCGAFWLPRVTGPNSLTSALAKDRETELRLVGALTGERNSIRAAFNRFAGNHARLPVSVSIWIGPEGDFTPAELDAILGAGVQAVKLGRHTLRAETAALSALSVLNAEFNEPR
jgi:16S rRNA (uracil1498-N3)-methyltransferase